MALTYSDLILMLRRTGRADEVLDWLPAAAGAAARPGRGGPRDADNLVSLCLLQAEYAGLLEGAGRAAEADRVRRLLADSYRLAIARDSRNPAPLNNLAWLLVEPPRGRSARPGPGGRAGRAGRRDGARPSAAYRNTLGVAHYRAGEWSAAADALEESMRLRSGGDPYDWLFLAMARQAARRRRGGPPLARPLARLDRGPCPSRRGADPLPRRGPAAARARDARVPRRGQGVRPSG